MAIALQAPEVLLPVAGVSVGVTRAGVKPTSRGNDLTLFRFVEQSRCSLVLTRNRFCAAPVVVARRHHAQARPLACVVNTGNANAGTGDAGIDDALRCCAAVAEALGVEPGEVLPFSTGVIGEPLPVSRIVEAIPRCVADARADGWLDASSAIMTTDTVAKGVSLQLDMDGVTVTLTGIAKGAGMICPDMATMLAFIATDALIDQETLDRLLREAVAVSFNRITIDGDTSTNDACLLVATGVSGARVQQPAALEQFAAALTRICQQLAQAIVRDGEGATRFITIDVRGAANLAEAEAVAYAVAHSPLVKTAAFAGDPNWGRILAAIGRSGLDDLDVAGVSVWLDDYRIVSAGARVPDYSEAEAARRMASAELPIRIELNRGMLGAVVWTTDLSYEYVRINAEYRS